jgi:hypothetical protein
MTKIFCLLLVLSFYCCNSFAERRYFYVPGLSGDSSSTFPPDAVYSACVNTIFPVGSAGGYGVSTYPRDAYDTARLLKIATIPLGSQVSFRCGKYDPSSGALLSVVDAQLTVSETCTAGASARLVLYTQIASFSVAGEAVPVQYPANPQCVNGCIAQHPGGQGLGLVAYSTIGEPVQVGTSIYVVATRDITLTGATCNFAGADQNNVTPPDEFPNINTLVDLSDERGSSGSSGGSQAVLDAVDKAAIAATATNTDGTKTAVTSMSNALQGKLETVAQNQTTGDSNNESRHQEQKTILSGILGALNSIDGKTGGGNNGSGSGNSNCGGANQPACNVSFGGTVADGVIGAMPADPVAEVPQGGLVSPGEGNLSDFKTSLNNAIVRPAGTCPTWNLRLEYFKSNYVFDQHCDIFNNNRATLEAICLVVWSVGALAIVLKA